MRRAARSGARGQTRLADHLLVWALLRSVVIVALYLVAYFLVPWDDFSDWPRWRS